MTRDQRVLYKIILASLMSSEGNSDQMSWDHKHVMFFLNRNMPINLLAYIFNHLCICLRETQKHRKVNIPYARLISEILHQGKLIQTLDQFGLATDEELCTNYGKVLSGMIMFHMRAKDE